MKQQDTAIKWKYFGRNSNQGPIYEIYRCPANGKKLAHQDLQDVQLLLKDGTWRPGMREVLLDELYNGDFDETSDELSEQEANDLITKWRSGTWPGKF